MKYMDGWTDEDHLIAAIWNLCGLAWTEEKRPELMDIPARMTATEPHEDSYCSNCKYFCDTDVEGYGLCFVSGKPEYIGLMDFCDKYKKAGDLNDKDIL